jgi:DNA adenine methylase
VPFPFEEYERMATTMWTCKGKVMVSINDHPDIRRAFDGFPMLGLSIKYSVNNTTAGGPSTSRELVITNWEPGTQTGGLF